MACEVCRDLRPKDCPGCAPVMNVNGNGVSMADVHDEMFRDVGEPVFVGFSEMRGAVYPDRYGYFPGCNEG
jgi:hypothetical protein